MTRFTTLALFAAMLTGCAPGGAITGDWTCSGYASGSSLSQSIGGGS